MSATAHRAPRARSGPIRALGSAEVRQRKKPLHRVIFDEVKVSLRPLLAYWFFLVTMFGAFCVAAMLDSPGSESVMVLACFGIVTFSCVAAGQLLALLRVRDWVLWGIWIFAWTVGFGFGVLAAVGGGAAVAPLMILLFLYIFLGPLFLVGGAFSLRTGRALMSTWVPLIYASGTAIIMAESRGKVSNWHAGSKWAVWDAFTFSVLGAGIALLLLFLVTREVQRLHHWRHSPRGLLMGSVVEKGAARPRLSCFGWILLVLLAGGLAVGTAAVGPYFWRTGPGDGDDGDHSGQDDQGDEDGKSDNDGQDGKNGKNGKSGKSGEGDGDGKSGKQGSWGERMTERARDGARQAGEQMQENAAPTAQRGIDLLSTLLTLLLMLLAALLFGYRPVKRLLLVRHLRRPYWEASPTTRIQQGWRLVEIAMGDAGVPPREGEPAALLCQRAVPVLRTISPGSLEVHGLAEAAEVRDRVAFGLGVRPDDLNLMDRVAQWAYDTVWDRLGDAGQLKAMYRGI